MMTIPSLSLEGKVAVVTGGGTGMGKAIAMGMAEAGASVVIAARNAERLEGVAQEIRAGGRRALAVPTDVSEKEQVDNLIQKTVVEFGTIDILVNSVGVVLAVKLLELRERGWDRTIDTNLKGSFLTTQAAAHVMIPHRSGSVINMGSLVLERTIPPLGAYNVAKAGIVSLTRVFAAELGRYGIRVNAIGPGMIKTDLSEPLWSRPGVAEKVVANIPLGRTGVPEDVVGTALFFASEASAYITGQIVYVDGGFLTT